MLVPMRHAVPFTCCWMLLACSSCGPAPVDDGFSEGVSWHRMKAILDAARTGDESAVDRIIEQLDSDDPAVRMVAIEALERLADETMGHVHYDDLASRDAAVDRWVRSRNGGGQQESGPDG
jgi:hypothetical protein